MSEDDDVRLYYGFTQIKSEQILFVFWLDIVKPNTRSLLVEFGCFSVYGPPQIFLELEWWRSQF